MIKVLIADDQELIRQSLQIVLNSRPDIMVTDVASNGQEVIRSVRKNKPDVIATDLLSFRITVACSGFMPHCYFFIEQWSNQAVLSCLTFHHCLINEILVFFVKKVFIAKYFQ